MLINHIGLFIVISVVVVLLLIGLVFLVRRGRKNSGDAENRQVYIGNLPYRATEGELRTQFSHYGRIDSVRIVKDRRTGRSKGYAFVTFLSARDAKKSLEAHGTELAGRSLVVHIAKTTLRS